jgi:hypothetical protein
MSGCHILSCLCQVANAGALCHDLFVISIPVFATTPREQILEGGVRNGFRPQSIPGIPGGPMISRPLGALALTMLFALTVLPAGSALAQDTETTAGEQPKEGEPKKKAAEAEPDC